MYRIYSQTQQDNSASMPLPQLVMQVLDGIARAVVEAGEHSEEKRYEDAANTLCEAMDWMTALGISLESVFEAPTIPERMLPLSRADDTAPAHSAGEGGSARFKAEEVHESLGKYWMNWSRNMLVMMNFYGSGFRTAVRDDILAALAKATAHWRAMAGIEEEEHDGPVEDVIVV